MTEQTIDTALLKTIRTARKIGRPKLAKMARMSERQLAKLEAGKGAAADLPVPVLIRLSDALDVPPMVLTGELPLAEADLEPAAAHVCTNGCCG